MKYTITPRAARAQARDAAKTQRFIEDRAKWTRSVEVIDMTGGEPKTMKVTITFRQELRAAMKRLARMEKRFKINQAKRHALLKEKALGDDFRDWGGIPSQPKQTIRDYQAGDVLGDFL